MDTIVKVLNAKVQNGDAKTVVEALKQIDPNAEGETVAEVLKKMNLGGGSGSSDGIPVCTIKIDNQTGADTNFDFLFPGLYNWLSNNDNALLTEGTPLPLGTIPVGETTLKCVPFIYKGEDENVVANTLVTKIPTDPQLSEMVNCSASDVNSYKLVVPTDATQNSSFTITLTIRRTHGF